MDMDNKRKKVLIAMSGGVDSSVAALLMEKKGFDCMGCTMRLWRDHTGAVRDNRDAGDVFDDRENRDVRDARAVCERIGIEYNVFNYEAEFREKVIEPFICSYERGETPNPCIRCNKYLKFSALYEKGKELGCDSIATGHYARIEERDGHYYLLKARDKTKDQTYVLYGLTEEQLAHTFFPLGELTKEEVRKTAEGYGFANSDKKDSQDICFVSDDDYAGLIRRYRNREYPKGDFVDIQGNILGTHEGIINYTVGQRRGLGISSDRRLYVKELDVKNNRVVLADDRDLFSRRLCLREFNWVTGEAPEGEFECSVKIRYRHVEQPAVVKILEDKRAEARFLMPQRAITVGQSAVLYDQDRVLGGGIIDFVDSE